MIEYIVDPIVMILYGMLYLCIGPIVYKYTLFSTKLLMGPPTEKADTFIVILMICLWPMFLITATLILIIALAIIFFKFLVSVSTSGESS